MEFLSEILKASISKVSSILIIFTGTICAGILVLFFYFNEIFSSFDVLKLILLSASITFPLYLLNMLIYTFPYLSNEYRKANFKSNEDLLTNMAIVAALFNTGTIYMSLFMSWKNSYDIYDFIKVAVIFEFFAVFESLQSLIEFYFSVRKVKFSKLLSNVICLSGFIFVVFLVSRYISLV